MMASSALRMPQGSDRDSTTRPIENSVAVIEPAPSSPTNVPSGFIGSRPAPAAAMRSDRIRLQPAAPASMQQATSAFTV